MEQRKSHADPKLTYTVAILAAVPTANFAESAGMTSAIVVADVDTADQLTDLFTASSAVEFKFTGATTRIMYKGALADLQAKKTSYEAKSFTYVYASADYTVLSTEANSIISYIKTGFNYSDVNCAVCLSSAAGKCVSCNPGAIIETNGTCSCNGTTANSTTKICPADGSSAASISAILAMFLMIALI